MMGIFKDKKGFTLAEMLMAVAIFGVASTVIAAVFINAANLENDTASYQKLQNDARYVMEKIAKEARGREIIAVYPGENPTSTVNFYADEYGDSLTISYDAANKNITYSIGGESDNLNSSAVAVEDLKFQVLPTLDPFSSIPASDVQPRLTIYAKFRNRPESKYAKDLSLQTTVSSKFYKR